jgi:hypothetical protein
MDLFTYPVSCEQDNQALFFFISFIFFFHPKQRMEREDPRGTNDGLRRVSKRLFIGTQKMSAPVCWVGDK